MIEHPATDHSFDKYDEPRLHMECLLSFSIVDLELPSRIIYPLGDHGVRTLGDLARMTRKELFGVRRLGEKVVEEIEECLKHLGLHIGYKN